MVIPILIRLITVIKVKMDLRNKNAMYLLKTRKGSMFFIFTKNFFVSAFIAYEICYSENCEDK